MKVDPTAAGIMDHPSIQRVENDKHKRQDVFYIRGVHLWRRMLIVQEITWPCPMREEKGNWADEQAFLLPLMRDSERRTSLSLTI